jgi:hypothetical protein
MNHDADRITSVVSYVVAHLRFAFGLGAALMAMQISSMWYATPDAAVYLSIARSIAHGGPITALGNPHLALPIGYPLIIAPTFLISDYPFIYISLLQWLMTVVFMAGVFRWASRFGQTAALLITALVMVNVSLWIYYHRTLSELAFTMVSVWAVLFLNAGIAETSQTRSTSFLAIGALLLALAASIRESGVVFAAGFVVAAADAALRSRISLRRALFLIAIGTIPAIVAVAAFVIFDIHRIHDSPVALGTHIAGFTDSERSLFYRINEGGRLRLSEIGRLLIPGMFKAYGKAYEWANVNMMLFIPATFLVAFGWFRMVRERCDVFAATLPLYFILYVLWAFDADTRYMLPMLPVLAGSLWFALDGMGQARIVALAALVLMHVAVATGYWLDVEVPRARECNTYWPTVIQMANSISKDKGSVAASGAADCPRLFMEFVLDRPVDSPPPLRPIGNQRWLLTPNRQIPPNGYGPVISGAGLELSVKH